MSKIKSLLKLAVLSSTLTLLSPSVLAESKWDGKYNSTFPFKMSKRSVCPKFLPIDIELKIEDSSVSGFIFNNGGGNKDEFCKLYHNGSISGSVDSQGNFIDVNIKQKDNHSRKYSSYKIIGNINNNLTLLSKSKKYHPPAQFLLTKYEDIESPLKSKLSNIENIKYPEEVSIKVNVSSQIEAQKKLDDVQSSIDMYYAISAVVKKQKPDLVKRVLKIVNEEISKLNKEKNQLQAKFSKQFATPIRPTNKKLNRTSFRASETFPKIPFYIPGSNEIGEMITIPRVTEDGFLVYRLDFLDPTSTYEKVRDSINIPHENINQVIQALLKVDEWTETAQENNLTRNIRKTALCIPFGRCDKKKAGIVSTEIIFQVYEDGSTAGRIQRNKGTFSTGYNLSVESSVLLSAYLTYMRDTGSKEFNIGNMSDDEVRSLFN